MLGKNEFIGPDGIRTKLAPGPAEVVKRGPFNVTLNLGPVRIEYVNTKSWVKITQRAESERELSVYFHVVGQPIPVTAVTSPQAMIAPLRVSQIITSP